MKLNIKALFTFTLTLFLFTLSMPPMAQTPDGMTPADEMVCDDLKGSTPGLYGLCVAYCEATDSEQDLTSEDKIASLATPSSKILNNYNKKRKDGDPQMPCATYFDEEACPAWTKAQSDTVGSSGKLATSYENYGWDNTNSSYVLDYEYGNHTNEAGDQLYSTRYILGYNNKNSAYNYAAHYQYTYNYTTGQYEVYFNNWQYYLTNEEITACQQEVKDHVMPEGSSPNG